MKKPEDFEITTDNIDKKRKENEAIMNKMFGDPKTQEYYKDAESKCKINSFELEVGPEGLCIVVFSI